jgi:hypothetical protein
MRARSHYRLIITRGGHAPAFMAGPDRHDRIEVLEIDSNEVVLFWELRPGEASKLARRLRVDLAELDPEQFLDAWMPTQAPLGA